MSKRKKVLKITLFIIIGIIVLGLSIFVGMFIHWINTTEIEMVSKTHIDFVVNEGQVIDYNAFINPQNEEIVFNQIKEDIRLQIANYMKENNFKLKEGHHYFPKRVIGNSAEFVTTFDEYISDFKFEKIE